MPSGLAALGQRTALLGSQADIDCQEGGFAALHDPAFEEPTQPPHFYTRSEGRLVRQRASTIRRAASLSLATADGGPVPLP